MKKTIISIIALAIMSIAIPVFAGDYVNGHYRNNGTYVEGYHRSSQNNTQHDNYSTKGNVNPYTGENGYKNPKY